MKGSRPAVAGTSRERKLLPRKRRASKGHAIRVSDLVWERLELERKNRSWDTLLRRMLGLPDRAGNEQPLVEGVLETGSGQLLLRMPGVTWQKLEEDAYEIALLNAAREFPRVKYVPRPLRMRELP